MSRSDFRIHSILLVKNEGDVIRHCLEEAAKWSDFVYVYDGDSTDDTWKIVQEMRSPQVIPFKQDGKVFKEGLRAEVFEAFRSQSRNGDWWCQLNADEFYIDNPKRFLGEVDSRNHAVWGLMVEYYLTPEDVERLDFSAPSREILPTLRHYRIFNTEPRFFRYRERLVWDQKSAWPRHMGPIEPRLIRFRHYPYRTPAQVQMRLDIRRDNRARGFEGWDHAKERSWREKIIPSAQLDYDRGDDKLVVRVALPSHAGSLPRRSLQRLMHGLGVWP